MNTGTTVCWGKSLIIYCCKINRSSVVNACRLVSQIPVLREQPNYSSHKKDLPTLKKESIAVQWWGEKLDLSQLKHYKQSARGSIEGFC
jgi:hypothetical protein